MDKMHTLWTCVHNDTNKNTFNYYQLRVWITCKKPFNEKKIWENSRESMECDVGKEKSRKQKESNWARFNVWSLWIEDDNLSS